MTKPRMLYFEAKDVLHLSISEEANANGELIGIEILEASTFVRDSILDGVQAKVLHLAGTGK